MRSKVVIGGLMLIVLASGVSDSFCETVTYELDELKAFYTHQENTRRTSIVYDGVFGEIVGVSLKIVGYSQPSVIYCGSEWPYTYETFEDYEEYGTTLKSVFTKSHSGIEQTFKYFDLRGFVDTTGTYSNPSEQLFVIAGDTLEVILESEMYASECMWIFGTRMAVLRIILRLSVDPNVPVKSDNWGRIKSLYRDKSPN